MKKTSLVLAMVLGLFVMLTLCYSSQAQAQVSLQCTMNGDQLWEAGTYNILIEADMSVVTVTFPGGRSLRYKPAGNQRIGVNEYGDVKSCTTYIEATSAMYDFGFFCDAPFDNTWTKWKIDRISGEIIHTQGCDNRGNPTCIRTYTGTCTKTELPRQKF